MFIFFSKDSTYWVSCSLFYYQPNFILVFYYYINKNKSVNTKQTAQLPNEFFSTWRSFHISCSILEWVFRNLWEWTLEHILLEAAFKCSRAWQSKERDSYNADPAVSLAPRCDWLPLNPPITLHTNTIQNVIINISLLSN